MSKKRILNITSRKKRDVMQQVTNIDSGTLTPGTLGFREAYLSGNYNYLIPWIATARPGIDQNGGAAGTIAEATRTLGTCYMRGLKESISVRSADGDPWKWRRICFTLKGDRIHSLQTANQILYNRQGGASASGVTRPVTNWPSTALAGGELEQLIFRGFRNQDWVDTTLAPVDTTRISVKYDKTINLTSGNESGFLKTIHRWHPMNKNIVYGDDQTGQGVELTPWSTEGKQGMGDYYVVDIFKSNGRPEAQLGLRYNSTLYWHEK